MAVNISFHPTAPIHVFYYFLLLSETTWMSNNLTRKKSNLQFAAYCYSTKSAAASTLRDVCGTTEQSHILSYYQVEKPDQLTQYTHSHGEWGNSKGFRMTDM